MRKFACVILVFVFSIAGCSSQQGIETTGDTGKAGGTIGYSAMSFKNPFFVVIRDNLEAAANAAGYELIANDADSDVSKQANHIDEFISKGVVAIVLNPTDKLAIGEAIKKANEAGIPVFTCDLQCTAEDVDIAGHIGTDNYQGGTLAGQAMVEILGDQGGEVLVLDYKQANSCVLRVDVFMEVINGHNKIINEDFSLLDPTRPGEIQIVAAVNGGGDEDIG